jgi:hypothetical protein
MTVIARSKAGAARMRRHRDERPGRVAESTQAPASPSLTDAKGSCPGTTTRRRREAMLVPQDSALYTCQCGFVFEAQVSTSVGCPHCGGAQAW